MLHLAPFNIRHLQICWVKLLFLHLDNFLLKVKDEQFHMENPWIYYAIKSTFKCSLASALCTCMPALCRAEVWFPPVPPILKMCAFLLLEGTLCKNLHKTVCVMLPEMTLKGHCTRVGHLSLPPKSLSIPQASLRQTEVQQWPDKHTRPIFICLAGGRGLS